MAGLPMVRTTALRMFLGAWPGRKYDKLDRAIMAETERTNLLWLTYKPSRPQGHVVQIIDVYEDEKGRLVIIMAEASYSKKYFKLTKIVEGDYRWKHMTGLMIVHLNPGFKVTK